MTDVSTPSPEYHHAMTLVALPRTLMGGTKAMRAAGEKFLPRFSAESLQNHRARIGRSVLFNATKKTVGDMVGRVFAKPTQLGPDVPAELVDLTENIDNAGRHLDVFARDLFYDGLQTGIAFILVDAPRAPVRSDGLPPTMADYAGHRPYFVHIRVEDLIGWKCENMNGVPTLTQIRIREHVCEADGDWGEKNIEQIRVIYPGRWQVWRKAPDGAWVVHEEGLSGFSKIPLVPVYLNRSAFMQGEPPLQDLCDLNVAHWQSASDQRNLLTIARVPILFMRGIDAETTLEIGASSAVRVGNPDADMKYVEHSGAAIGAGDRDLQNLLYEMQAMGLSLLVEKPGQSATGEVRDDAKENSTLSQMVGALQDGLEAALGFMAEYMRLGEDAGGSVIVNRDFGVTGRMADLQWLTSAVISRKIDDKTYLDELKRRGALADSVDVDVVLHRLDSAAPDGRMNLDDDHEHEH